jgi:hypothetical protein
MPTTTGPCGTLDVLQLGVLVVLQRDFGGLAGGPVVSSSHRHLAVTDGGESSSQGVVLEY